MAAIGQRRRQAGRPEGVAEAGESEHRRRASARACPGRLCSRSPHATSSNPLNRLVPAVLTTAIVAAACAPTPAPPLTVEYSGCETVLRGPVCVADPEAGLALWIATAAEAEVTIGGRPPAAPPVEVQDGRRYELPAPLAAGELTVESRLGRGRARWTLEVAPSRRPEWHHEANRLARAGDLAAAAALLEPRLAAPAPADRALAAGSLARIALRRGDGGPAEELLRRALADHREAGDLYRQVRDGLALVDRLLPRRDFVEVRRLLAALPEIDGCADAAFHRDLELGFLAHQTGDVRSAERHLAAAAAQAERVGTLDGRRRILIEEVRTQGLQRLGRLDEAAARLAGLEAAELGDPCDRAKLLNNRGWGLLLGAEAGRPLGDPVPPLTAALELFDSGCRILDERRNVRVNLALARLQGGDLAGARRWLDQAEAVSPGEPLPNLLLWAWDVEARLRLAEARPEAALALYDELALRARELASPEAEWRVALWRARAREAAGDDAGALADYRRAERLLEREQLLVPMHAGRGTFVAQRARATRRHLDLLLRLGRNGEALELVRRARGRYLRSVRRFTSVARLGAAEREAWDRTVADYQRRRLELDGEAAASWRLPAGEWRAAEERRRGRRRALQDRLDELLAILDGPADPADAAASGDPALAQASLGQQPVARHLAGELLLAYHPLDDGWAGLAADASGVVARRLGAVDPARLSPAELAERLLEPFAERIAAARRVRVLAHGPLWQVDFHALPFAGGLLLAGREVVYSLDLPGRGDSAGLGAGVGADGPGPALVVADPEGNLPGARREAAAVAPLLARRLAVDRLTGAEATGPALRRRLAGAGLLHYAGHGVSAGWDSRLPLAGGGALTIDDVLVLAPAPPLVVLSGCETAAVPADAPAEGMGLAHAFLIAGAEAVVATVRRVPDEASSALVAGFYEELAAGGTPAEALRRAQLARARTAGDLAWASFRVIEP